MGEGNVGMETHRRRTGRDLEAAADTGAWRAGKAAGEATVPLRPGLSPAGGSLSSPSKLASFKHCSWCLLDLLPPVLSLYSAQLWVNPSGSVAAPAPAQGCWGRRRRGNRWGQPASDLWAGLTLSPDFSVEQNLDFCSKTWIYSKPSRKYA